MIDLKKKCWREKVTAEITVAHMLQFAREMGTKMNAAEAAAFLNEKGRAQAVWTYMMEAGEEFLKADLVSRTGLHNTAQNAAQTAVPANPLHNKSTLPTRRVAVSYQ